MQSVGRAEGGQGGRAAGEEIKRFEAWACILSPWTECLAEA